MTARELLKILHGDGWIEVRQKGSHIQMRHPDKNGLVTIPLHSGDIPKGTLNSILKQAHLEKE